MSEQCATNYESLPDGKWKNGIWWLASYPKSGNTWARMFINSAVTRFPCDINSAYQYACGDMAICDYQAVSCLPVGAMGKREAVYLRPAVLINMLASRVGRDVCLKTHSANLTIDDIPMCPAKLSKGAVYIVRDPRDVAVSFAKHMGVDIDRAIELMCSPTTSIHKEGTVIFHYLSSWSHHVRSWLSKSNPIPTGCVRYEDMIADPRTTFRNMLGALGLSELVNDKALDFGIEQSEFDKLSSQEGEVGFREVGKKQDRFFNSGRVGTWRKRLTSDQVRKIEESHCEVMRELGYTTEEIDSGTKYEPCQSCC